MLEALKPPKKAVVVHWDRRKDALRKFQEGFAFWLSFLKERTLPFLSYVGSYFPRIHFTMLNHSGTQRLLQPWTKGGHCAT